MPKFPQHTLPNIEIGFGKYGSHSLLIARNQRERFYAYAKLPPSVSARKYIQGLRNFFPKAHLHQESEIIYLGTFNTPAIAVSMVRKHQPVFFSHLTQFVVGQTTPTTDEPTVHEL